MTKINFTQQHYAQLRALATEALFTNATFKNILGTPIGIVELLHQTTINSLVTMKANIEKIIRQKEDSDEWNVTSEEQTGLEILKNKKELINLIIGFKKYTQQVDENLRIRQELNDTLKALKESQKTPDDKIREIEEQLKSLDSPNF